MQLQGNVGGERSGGSGFACCPSGTGIPDLSAGAVSANEHDVVGWGYHVVLTVGLRNAGRERKVAYQLDGPTGCRPSWWYSTSPRRTLVVGAVECVWCLVQRLPKMIPCDDCRREGEVQLEQPSAISASRQYFDMLIWPA